MVDTCFSGWTISAALSARGGRYWFGWISCVGLHHLHFDMCIIRQVFLLSLDFGGGRIFDDILKSQLKTGFEKKKN